VTDVPQRRLRDSWGLIAVILLAVFFGASAIYRVAQHDWTSAVTQAAFGAILIGVLVYSRARFR
jgi:CHASE2 domain-containing sensor protein